MLPAATGGLLAIQAVAIGMTSPHQVAEEIANNLEVLLLLVFMVAGIYFMKQLLLFCIYEIAVEYSVKNYPFPGLLSGVSLPISIFGCLNRNRGSYQRIRWFLYYLS
ncbi:sodium/proton antiporter [Yersinia pestis]|uniref:Sodium/proton antiporter n=1 Tax=Yersinia pestis TaxID=632 RepID=A0AAX2HZP4_YERPE|nr:sodium/proton antiporter [Yersinia pestis]